ncbi:peptidase M23 [Kitasatospora sp. NPDC088346]|uniref:CIS tube protein n=1 Tax=Kitasatospora sp. NPDC088346 TaxID=3364073 RepID=UPI0038295EB3
MSTTTPARATLTAYEPPKEPGARPGGVLGSPVPLQFNPHTLTVTRGASWLHSPAAKAEDVSVPEFRGAQPRRLSVEVFLDATAHHDGSVVAAVDAILEWCSPTAATLAANAPCAPRVRFTWGTFHSASFFGYLESATATYTLFDQDGRPLRAVCAVQITEAGDPTPGQNPTSGARTARRVHRLVGGDSLELLAHREYGDATAWRLIAETNGIDDPMRMRPGTELLVPACEDRELG